MNNILISRIPNDFNPEIYKKLHLDLINMNTDQLIMHYLNYGIHEKRIYKIELPNDFNPEIYKKLHVD